MSNPNLCINAQQEETLKQAWLNTGIPAQELADVYGIPAWLMSDWVRAKFTEAQRKERNSRILSQAQHTKRVANPDWYEGPGRRVPLKNLRCCECMGLKRIPEGGSVIHLDGDTLNFACDNLAIVDKKTAKKLKEMERNG